MALINLFGCCKIRGVGVGVGILPITESHHLARFSMLTIYNLNTIPPSLNLSPHPPHLTPFPQQHLFIPSLNHINIHPPRKYINFPPPHGASPDHASHLPNAYESGLLSLYSRTVVQEQKTMHDRKRGKLCCMSAG
jgi:hypothetical protein